MRLHELAIANCLAHEPFFSPPMALLSPDAYSGIPVIDNDWALQALSDQILRQHTSCYGLDSHDQPCWLHIQASPMRSLWPSAAPLAIDMATGGEVTPVNRLQGPFSK